MTECHISNDDTCLPSTVVQWETATEQEVNFQKDYGDKNTHLFLAKERFRFEWEEDDIVIVRVMWNHSIISSLQVKGHKCIKEILSSKNVIGNFTNPKLAGVLIPKPMTGYNYKLTEGLRTNIMTIDMLWKDFLRLLNMMKDSSRVRFCT